MKPTRTINPLLAALIIGLATAATGFAASIVEATFTKDGKVVARTIYTGPDGGRGTDPAKYWNLLVNAPQSSSDVTIKADEKHGKLATLKGEIGISVQIRNKISMGSVKTDTLTLVRKADGKAGGWHLSKEELKRVMKLLKREGKKPKSAKVDPSTGGPFHPNTEEAARKALEPLGGNAPEGLRVHPGVPRKGRKVDPSTSGPVHPNTEEAAKKALKSVGGTAPGGIRVPPADKNR